MLIPTGPIITGKIIEHIGTKSVNELSTSYPYELGVGASLAGMDPLDDCEPDFSQLPNSATLNAVVQSLNNRRLGFYLPIRIKIRRLAAILYEPLDRGGSSGTRVSPILSYTWSEE